MSVGSTAARRCSLYPDLMCTATTPCHTNFCNRRHAVLAQQNAAPQFDPAAAPIRAALADFCKLMEAKLRKNDHKRGWRELPIMALFRQLMLELEEFRVADEFLTVAEARGELVDVANFCMILHDRLGMLIQDKARHEQT